jgi:NADPH:quinone reductase
MRAIVLEKFGGLDSLVIKDIPEPEPKAGHVVIQVKAFGINHAEIHMRRGEWAEAAPVSGIECVGIVKSCPGGEFPIGAKVAALMGGLGRTINGRYAEYTRAPASNVALIESDLPWTELAAIPETYATAWTCLFRNLEIGRGELLVIRGATSSFGQAALKMAVNAGTRVIATTRNRARFAMLEKLGAERCESSGGIYRSMLRRRRGLMRCSTWWVIPSCSIPSLCFAAAAVRVWPAGWVVSIPSQTSIRCCKWRAAFI